MDELPKKLNIVVVGCGGIGTYLLDPLCRYLNYLSECQVKLTLVDGDHYELKNQTRQVFDTFGPKAVVTANRLKTFFPNLKITAEPRYLTNDNFFEIIQNKSIVFGCVDNHKTRKLISDMSQSHSTITVISGGNELKDGSFQVYIRFRNKNITNPLDAFHPEIKNATDENPGERAQKCGCDVIVESSPQLVFTNNLVAAGMASAFYSYLNGYYKEYQEDAFNDFYIDVPSCKMISRKRPLIGK